MEEDSSSEKLPIVGFKKPILIGKIGKLPRRVLPIKEPKIVIKEIIGSNEQELQTESIKTEDLNESITPSQEVTDKLITLPYREPVWAGIPDCQGAEYGFEILKCGSIIGNTKLTEKSFWVFGRLANCDICMAHPTISRYHAVLQYRIEEIDGQSRGFYLYDLNSTHGTFLNKNRIKPRIYVRVQVGHMIKLGCSTRTYILTGPEEDTEKVSELSITELKQQRAEELLKREQNEKEAILKEELDKEAKRKKDEERGVDWGMGDDADEETDVTENPFAQSNNEELYLDDPKKALRGFMEREGFDLEYDCSEQGMGQFLCKVILPIDDERGKSIIAEVIHKGKKKEAVIQCALEACRILDRHGLLRQATHESRKRKAKNWEENDFYDSDDDTYLDRTGTIEKKRENRMKAKVPQLPETYQSLLEKEKNISNQINDLQHLLETSRKATSNISNDNEDSLDSYMKELKKPKLDKQKLTKIKTDINKLKQEHANIIKLANVARPADLPLLVPQYTDTSTSPGNIKNNKLPIFGKRIKVKVQIPQQQNNHNVSESDSDEDVEINIKTTDTDDVNEDKTIDKDFKVKDGSDARLDNSPEEMTEEPNSSEYSSNNQLTKSCLLEQTKLENNFSKVIPHLSIEYKDNIINIWNNFKKIVSNEEENDLDLKIIEVEKREIATCIKELKNMFHQKLESKASKKVTLLLDEIDVMGIDLGNINERVAQTGTTLLEIAKVLLKSDSDSDQLDKERNKSSLNDQELTVEEVERKRKKNQRRLQQRQERTEVERLRGYEEDAQRDDYNMWVPPQNQTGDGRTTLNDKLGY